MKAAFSVQVTVALLLLLLAARAAPAATRYVDVNSSSPTPPYTNWGMAARTIQEAIDVTEAGDEVLVTNGVYATGGREVGGAFGGLTNRVALTQAIRVRSVNGSEVTTIAGWQVPGTTNGDGAVRCAYLTNGALLAGFTLTNGATRTRGRFPEDVSGGGTWCESTDAVVSNCVLFWNSAYVRGGGAAGGTLINCIISSNSAPSGGGASEGTLNTCVLVENSAGFGGGAANSTLDRCSLIHNQAAYAGGGASDSTLTQCGLGGNAILGMNDGGGGALRCFLSRCTLYNNSAPTNGYTSGGGALDSTLINCLLSDNSAAFGGGAFGSSLTNCTIACNSAGSEGGGAGFCAVNSCIVYYNSAPAAPNYDDQWGGIVDHSCTTPLPKAGTGNITNEPAFVNSPYDFRLLPGSPCIDAGADVAASITNDLAGIPRPLDGDEDGRTAFDMGAYEYRVLHVWPDSPAPARPYADWASAAHTIQEAIDVAQTGETVLATNGVYATGGRVVDGTMGNRVAVTKAVTVRSVNGPEFTIIQGRQVPGTTNGDGAIRCVYLTYGAVLSGFTLTNGATRTLGDLPREICGGGVWSSRTALVSNCVIVGNSASYDGGGAYGGSLEDCALTGNSAFYGGGAFSATLNHCTVVRNSASYGGGASGGALNRCTLSDNSAGTGGGADGATLRNCALTGNSAWAGGIGWLVGHGGGARGGTLENCTLTGNSASQYGGGVSFATVNNCIVYFNTAPHDADHYGSTLNYCDTTPLPSGGVGNLSADPQLASTSHLSAQSPCRGAGSAAYATGTDIDGEPWASPPSIGCDEYQAGASGILSVSFDAASTNVAAGFPLELTARIDGNTTVSVWDFGDGVRATNQAYAAHVWTVPGDYPLVLQAYNGMQPGGTSARVTVHVVPPPVHYVAAGSTNPVPPYATWETASAEIQAAVDAATVPGAVVLVTNGVYASGGRAVRGTMTNRVAVDRPIVVRSVHGPEFTLVHGRQPSGLVGYGRDALRCVYLTNRAVLTGFTLTNGATQAWADPELSFFEDLEAGAGVWCESASAVVSNCVFTENRASFGGGGAFGGTLHRCTLSENFAGFGGGALYSTLNHCTLTGNTAGLGGGVYAGESRNCLLTGNAADYHSGGGAAGGTLINCTLVGNSSSNGGGAYQATLNNCVVYFNNAAGSGANYNEQSTLNYCCTTPQPTHGVGNLTVDPTFVDRANGNLRLHFNSPCINAGFNGLVAAAADLDGAPRIAGGTVDIGAYEFQAPSSIISYAWLQQYSLPTDGSADFTDPDGDRMNNWQEWRCATDPISTLSVLRLLTPEPRGSNVVVRWESVPDRLYVLEWSTNLLASPPFLALATNLPGQVGTTAYTHTNAPDLPPSFYRVGVE